MPVTDRPAPWSREEVEATVASYFHMLTLELAGQDYNKAAHRRALLKMLDDRSEAAIELKHCNITAILIELGCPSITGYKPRGNYQSLLFNVVADRVENDSLFNHAAREAVERPAVAPIIAVTTGILEDAPERRPRAESESKPYRGRPPVKREYLALEARNRALGLAGEEFVVAYERAKLIASGKERYANKVDHVAASRGDGLGFDILSFETTGSERFIEVKTTAFGKETPFYVSKNEIAFAESQPQLFHLCRLFDFRKSPRLFFLRGSIARHCNLDPVSFVAKFS